MIAEDQRLAEPRRVQARADDIRAIIVSPTRELAEQIGVEAKKLCQRTGIIVQTAVGGTQKNMMLQRTRREGCHILVATPGRLNDLLNDQYSGVDAPRLSTLVLDEADRMLDVGFDRELQEILRVLPDRTQVPRQTLLFSATIPRDVVSLARSYVDPSNFEFVQTVGNDEVQTHETVPQHIVTVRDQGNMFPTILELLEREAQSTTGMPLKAIVFLRTTAMVQLIHEVFRDIRWAGKKDGTSGSLPEVLGIHSKLNQSQRTRAAEDFRRSESAVLFSSDVTARGMDFPNVSHVIQIGLPPDREQYIHRLGRTGRAGKPGQGWLLVTEDEVPAARRTLPGLPIQRSQGLQAATRDFNSEETLQLPVVQRVSRALQKAPQELLENAYFSAFSGASNREVGGIAASMAEWTKLAWGWEEPPAFSTYDARKRGLLGARGIRVDDNYRRQQSSSGGDRSSFGRGGGFGGGFGGNSRGDFRGGRGNGGNSFGRGGSSF